MYPKSKIDKMWASITDVFSVKYIRFTDQIQKELVRKALHFLIALVPQLAWMDKGSTMILLAGGILFYVFSEKLRNDGKTVFIVSDLTVIAAREYDKGRFIIGPVTLGLGAMLALMLYPEPAATIAIYALAFGDGFASLVGITFGGKKIPFTKGKTFSGSFACFLSVYFVTLNVTNNHLAAFGIALLSTLLEVFPTGDFDNIIVPVGVGFAASKLVLFL